MPRRESVVELYRHPACQQTVGTDEFDIEPASTPLYARLQGECPECGAEDPIVSYHTYITKREERRKVAAD